MSEDVYQSDGGAEPVIVLELVFAFRKGTKMRCKVHLNADTHIAEDIITNLLRHDDVDFVDLVRIVLAVNLCVDVTYSSEGIDFECFGSVDEQMKV